MHLYTPSFSLQAVTVRYKITVESFSVKLKVNYELYSLLHVFASGACLLGCFCMSDTMMSQDVKDVFST